MSGWPKRCKLARSLLREYSYKRRQLAHELLGQLGVFLTLVPWGVGARHYWPSQTLVTQRETALSFFQRLQPAQRVLQRSVLDSLRRRIGGRGGRAWSMASV